MMFGLGAMGALYYNLNKSQAETEGDCFKGGERSNSHFKETGTPGVLGKSSG